MSLAEKIKQKIVSSEFLYSLGALAIFSGLILTFFSWLEVCSESCEVVHAYRLFGFRFETLGFMFFLGLGIVYFFSWKSKTAQNLTGILLSLALGAELAFIYIQKYVLMHWCPLCLSIAFTVACAFAAFF